MIFRIPDESTADRPCRIKLIQPAIKNALAGCRPAPGAAAGRLVKPPLGPSPSAQVPGLLRTHPASPTAFACGSCCGDSVPSKRWHRPKGGDGEVRQGLPKSRKAGDRPATPSRQEGGGLRAPSPRVESRYRSHVPAYFMAAAQLAMPALNSSSV